MRSMKIIQAENCRQIIIMDSLSNIQALNRIYNEPQGMNLKIRMERAQKFTQEDLLYSIERNTNEYDDCITCIRSTKGQEISKANFLETPLPKKRPKFSVLFWTMELLEKCLLRLPYLYVPTYLLTLSIY